ncbi:hypothetical protein BH09PSE4_BH09PSE4_07760 [soil metagenome]
MTRTLRHLIARLRRDRRGSTVIEFAIVAPVMCLLLVGAFDTAHTLYARATLQGIVQKTARDATLEDSTDTAAQTTLDDKVKAQVRALANNATIVITRRYYRTFSAAAAAQAEAFTDTNHNGTCNGGEPYVDANNNGVWDADGGDAGQGGAKDRTLYTVVVTYPRFFPLWKFIGGSNITKLTSTTVLENQPYSDQGSYTASTVRNCT